MAALGCESGPRLHTFNSQELANTAWAFAVADVRSDECFGPGARFAEMCDRVEWNDKQLNQLHQWSLWRAETGCEWPPLPPQLERRSRAAFASAQVHPSRMQRHVCYALGSLGLPSQEEVRIPEGYSIDVATEWGGVRVGIEVDGPSHFRTDRRPTGSTVLKRRQLRHFGWTLLSVPYWEWEALRDEDRFIQRQMQCAYLAEALDEATGTRTTASGDGWVAIDCTSLLDEATAELEDLPSFQGVAPSGTATARLEPPELDPPPEPATAAPEPATAAPEEDAEEEEGGRGAAEEGEL